MLRPYFSLPTAPILSHRTYLCLWGHALYHASALDEWDSPLFQTQPAGRQYLKSNLSLHSWKTFFFFPPIPEGFWPSDRCANWPRAALLGCQLVNTNADGEIQKMSSSPLQILSVTFLGDGGPDLSSQLMMVGVSRWMAIFKGYTDLLTCCCVTRVLHTRFDWSLRFSWVNFAFNNPKPLNNVFPSTAAVHGELFGEKTRQKVNKKPHSSISQFTATWYTPIVSAVYPQCPALQPLKHLSTLSNAFLTLELVVCPLWKHILLNILHCHNHEIRFKKKESYLHNGQPCSHFNEVLNIYTNTIPTKVLSHYIDICQHWYYRCFGLMHPPLMVWEKKM